jgi:hypothetical protein
MGSSPTGSRSLKKWLFLKTVNRADALEGVDTMDILKLRVLDAAAQLERIRYNHKYPYQVKAAEMKYNEAYKLYHAVQTRR